MAAPSRSELIEICLQKGTERRDAGSWSNHDDWNIRIGGQAEGVRTLHIDLDVFAGRDALALAAQKGCAVTDVAPWLIGFSELMSGALAAMLTT